MDQGEDTQTVDLGDDTAGIAKAVPNPIPPQIFRMNAPRCYVEIVIRFWFPFLSQLG